ncbi:MAG: PHB depolymerase family esterase [Hyphomicrobiales bacterium]
MQSYKSRHCWILMRLNYIRLIRAVLIAISLGLAAAQSSQAAECGFNEESLCDVPLGSYYAVEPETDGDAPRPAVIFFHGGSGWGSRIFTVREQMTKDFIARGYVVIAPNGKKRPGSRFGPGWAFIPQFEPHRDDLAFVKEIIKDAGTKFNIDPARILMSGYSIGGSLTSYIACKEPTVAAAFAPVAGGFWRPHPVDCEGPVKLLHTHGWRDQTVPLEGRPLGEVPGGHVQQGDIYQTLNQWRIENECVKYRADKFITDGPFWRRIWTHCVAGTALEFALHPGGHEVPAAWATLAIDWFESVTAQKGTD